MSSFIIDNGQIYACGNNSHGQLGLNDNTHKYSIFTEGPCNIIFMSISVSYYHTIGIDIEGNLWSTGQNDYGQLGLNDIQSRSVFTKVPCDTTFTNVSAGYNHTIALDIDGNLWTAGDNIYGQLGALGNTFRQLKFTKVNPSTTSDTIFTNVFAGYRNSIAIDIKGNLWSTGQNDNGQLGLNDKQMRRVFTKVPSMIDDTFFTNVSADQYHTIALDIDGNIWATGRNKSGELGSTSNYSQSSFIKVTDNGIFTNIAVGRYHTIALDIEGNIWATGNNQWGQLGLDDKCFLW